MKNHFLYLPPNLPNLAPLCSPPKPTLTLLLTLTQPYNQLTNPHKLNNTLLTNLWGGVGVLIPLSSLYPIYSRLFFPTP